jgi:putative ABC transport system ATP-binding protein
MGIELQQITKTYVTGDTELHVLKGISLLIENGEICSIMGPSGSGKSTLMNIIGCLDAPTGGRYLLDGQDISALPNDALARVRNRTIGFVFQSYNLIPRTTALDNVVMPMVYSGVPTAERTERAAAALSALGLASRMHHMPNALSGGQQQRVAIARAIVMRPSLILADEPTGALDSRASLELMAILQQLNARLGITMVIVTHEPMIAAQTGRIIRMIDGQISGDDKLRRLHHRAASSAR